MLLSDQDPVAQLRVRVAKEMGVDPPGSGLQGGFKEFYASPMRQMVVRVIPWHVTSSLEEYLSYERSRQSVREAFGSRAERYVDQLDRRLREMLGDAPKYLALSYVQYLYVARTLSAK